MRSGMILSIRPASGWSVSDIDILMENLVLNQYRFRDTVKSGDTIVDIGAHIGIFSLLAAYACPDVTVFAFEPQSDNFALLRENVALNPRAHIIPINRAVASDRTRDKLYKAPSNTGAHSLFGCGGSFETVESTELRTVLDSLPNKRIDLLKLDCEGAEFDIIRHASIEDLRRIRQIVMEIHETVHTEGYRVEALLGRLAEAGLATAIQRRMRYSDQGTFHVAIAKRKTPVAGSGPTDA